MRYLFLFIQISVVSSAWRCGSPACFQFQTPFVILNLKFTSFKYWIFYLKLWVFWLTKRRIFLYPHKQSLRGGIYESVCRSVGRSVGLSMCPCFRLCVLSNLVTQTTGNWHNDGSTIYYYMYIGKVTKSQETYFVKANFQHIYQRLNNSHMPIFFKRPFLCLVYLNVWKKCVQY